VDGEEMVSRGFAPGGREVEWICGAWVEERFMEKKNG